MKLIHTKLEPFVFVYDKNTVLNLNSDSVEVTDAIAEVLEQRLGKNITIEGSETPEPGDDTLETLAEEKAIAEQKAAEEKAAEEVVVSEPAVVEEPVVEEVK